MKTPLRYQLSEYDCGPTALLDALGYLFEREEIPPEVIRNIMLYSLDCYGSDGVSGKSGTSPAAMMFLSSWLNGYGRIGQLAVTADYAAGGNVYLGGNGPVSDALRRGGAAVVRLYLDGWHYVLLTGEQEGAVRVFDPYYTAAPFADPSIRLVTDDPCRSNRLVPQALFNREALETYALGPAAGREAVLLFNERTRLTAEKTIEYFI